MNYEENNASAWEYTKMALPRCIVAFVVYYAFFKMMVA